MAADIHILSVVGRLPVIAGKAVVIGELDLYGFLVARHSGRYVSPKRNFAFGEWTHSVPNVQAALAGIIVIKQV